MSKLFGEWSKSDFFMLVAMLIVFLQAGSYLTREGYIVSSPSEGDIKATIACGSDSMGVEYRCGQTIYGETLVNGEKLFEGRVYVFNHNTSSTGTTIHRLVQCLDSDCNSSVFKGDNNLRGEMVNRSDILYRVVMKET